MHHRPEIHVSIDVGCYQHSVAVGLSSGEVLEEFDIAHDPNGFSDFFRRIETQQKRYSSAPVCVAMEGYNGHARPFDSLIRQRDYRLFNINNLKLARFKEIFPAAAKTDRIDARKGLELFQLADHLPLAKGVLQEIAATPSVNDKLKRLTRRRKALVEEKVSLLSRLQTDLRATCPSLLAQTRDVSNRWFLNFLTHTDELTKLARLRPTTVSQIPGIGKKYSAIIRQWQAEAEFSHDVDYVGPMILEDAKRILELLSAIKALQSECEALMPESDLAERIDSLPGFGVICASELAGEIGTIERFRNESSLALYLGMANLSNSSGKRQGARAPNHVNKRAKSAMMTGVGRHRKLVPESQKYYEKKRTEGKKHNQAVRAPGRHLCRILFKMLSQDRDYEIR